MGALTLSTCLPRAYFLFFSQNRYEQKKTQTNKTEEKYSIKHKTQVVYVLLLFSYVGTGFSFFVSTRAMAPFKAEKKNVNSPVNQCNR